MFAGHIVLTAAIQAAHRFKHGESFAPDVVDLVLQTITLAVTVACIHYALSSRGGRPSWLLRLLGDISYPLFLVHLPLGALLIKWGWTQPAILYGVSVAVAGVMYLVLDRYSQRRPKSTADETPTRLAPIARPR